MHLGTPFFLSSPSTKKTFDKFPGHKDSFFQNIMQILKKPFPLKGLECLQTLEIPTIFLCNKQEPEIWERNEVLRVQN